MKKYNTSIEIIMEYRNKTVDDLVKSCRVAKCTVMNWIKGGTPGIQHIYLTMSALDIPNDIDSKKLFQAVIWNDAKINIDGGRSKFKFRRELFERLGIPIDQERDYLEWERPEVEKVEEKESYVIKDIFGTKVLSKNEVITAINCEMRNIIFSEVSKPEEEISININDIYIVKVTKGDNYGLKSSKLIDCKVETVLRLLDDPNVVFLMPFIEHYAEKE